MVASKVVQLLGEDHACLSKAAGCLLESAEAVERGGGKTGRRLEKLLQFLDDYALSAHHEREEMLLEALHAKAGAEIETTIRSLEHEHVELLANMDLLRSAVERVRSGPDGGGEFAWLARGVVRSLRSHIKLEDEWLAEAVATWLSEEEERRLLESYEARKGHAVAFDVAQMTMRGQELFQESAGR